MQTVLRQLPDNVQELKNLLLQERELSAEKDTRIDQLTEQYQQILEQFRLAQQRQFGRSSEAGVDQLGLFNESEEIVETDDVPEAEQETITYTRNKPKRKPLPKDLPRDIITHDIEDKTCACCSHELHRMGEETNEQLEFIPASIKVIEHVRLKYSCRHCEQQGIKANIQIAPVPPSPIPKSIATPSLLSQIITSKYQYALPLYRQEQMFRQYGIDLSRKTMADWMIRSSELLIPVYDRLKTVQLQQAVVRADETPIKVIHEDKHLCYMWVYCTGTDSPNDNLDSLANIVLYDYQASRSGSCPAKYLAGFRGYLQVDGYAGYAQTGAVLAGCMAHARRKFIEAQKLQVKGKVGKADWAINHIRKLYRIESQIKDLSATDKQKEREERAKPLLDQFKAWLDKSVNQVPPKSAVGKAIAYSLGQWGKLERYLECGHLQIDNNRAERAIKPFVIGRKNWLFANTANGANASAVLYSLIETAKANGLTPFDYLKLLMEELPKNPADINRLLPWNVEIPRKAET